MTRTFLCTLLAIATLTPNSAFAEGEWEVTRESELALKRGLVWLAKNQGPDGNWQSNDLGLVSMGALAFLSAGHGPGRGRYGSVVSKALDYVIRNAKKEDGLLNISNGQRDMYNHGLATFVLGQAHGMYADRRINRTLDRALKLITSTQCDDGGWDYHSRRQARGHDLSLAVMQAKALRSAMDSGLEVPQEVIDLAIKSVREHYAPKGLSYRAPEAEQKKRPGQFTYSKGGGGATLAMAAAGVVCLQEFGQYDDWRIAKTMEIISARIQKEKPRGRNGQVPFDGYTLYYVGQALYQVGGADWRKNYPKLRDHLVAAQIVKASDAKQHGRWQSGGHVGGKPGELYGTSVACFILAMPNRYLPILQEGKIGSLKGRFGKEKEK